MLVQLTSLQARIIGVLIEKEITTPEQYPLSLNALTLGCNQKSSREPIMQLSESDVQNGLDELRAKNLLFEHQGSASRVVKYKHRFCNTEFSSLQFTPKQLALICVLLLRGPQTPGELRTRSSRLAEFDNVTEVEHTLSALCDFHGDAIIKKLSRELGKRESRFVQLFTPFEELLELVQSNTMVSENSHTAAHPSSLGQSNELKSAMARIEALETQVAKMSLQLDSMQETIEILSS